MSKKVFLSLLGSGLLLTIPFVSQVVSQEATKQQTSDTKKERRKKVAST